MENKYFDSLKANDEIVIEKCGSILQDHPIEGVVIFDSWDKKYETVFVSTKTEPKGKRFLINAYHIIIPK